MVNYCVLVCVFVCLMIVRASGSVLVIGNNVTLSFDDIEANFAPSVKLEKNGILYVAEPLDACLPLTNQVQPVGDGIKSPFVMIIRGGGCSFEYKVRRAQAAGFKAAIVYDNDNGDLVAMAGNSAGINIPAIFVSKASGEMLMNYVGAANVEVWILPSYVNSSWSIMAFAFIALLAASAVCATCFFVRRHRVRRGPRASRAREFHGMSSRLVKAIPSLIFTVVQEDNSTSRTCSICLEDYDVGEKLRVLPCRHKFHAICVDAWLTSWRTFCPVCKRDVRTTTGNPPASESTPLLLSRQASNFSSDVSSAQSSLASSAAIQINPSYSRSPSVSFSPSISSTPYNHHSLQSYHQSSHLSTSRSSMDLRNASSQRSRASYLASPRSLGFPTGSPLNSRYISPYVPSPSNASSYIGSSSQQQRNALHCSESAASFSPFASAQSLPGVD